MKIRIKMKFGKIRTFLIMNKFQFNKTKMNNYLIFLIKQMTNNNKNIKIKTGIILKIHKTENCLRMII